MCLKTEAQGIWKHGSLVANFAQLHQEVHELLPTCVNDIRKLNPPESLLILTVSFATGGPLYLGCDLFSNFLLSVVIWPFLQLRGKYLL